MAGKFWTQISLLQLRALAQTSQGLAVNFKSLSNSIKKAGSNLKEVLRGQAENKANPSTGSSGEKDAIFQPAEL